MIIYDIMVFTVDVGFLMRLYHSTQAENKLKKCFKDLSLGYLLNNYTFWMKAKNNVENMLSLFDKVICEEIDTTRTNSYCWKTRFTLHLDTTNDLLTGKLGDYQLFDNDASILSDPRYYYHLMLKYNSGIIDSRGINQSFICIPRVYLAGLPKSGTTSIDNLLTLHPLIKHGLSKEPRWWSPPLKEHNRFVASVDYFAKYALQYSNTIERIKNDNNILLIDSSPNLFSSWSNIGVAEDFEDICLIPISMSIVLPNPLFIVILRNPIDFLYSRFWYSCSSTVYNNVTLKNPEVGPYVFHSMVIRRLGIFSKCRLLYSTERCAFAQAYIQDATEMDVNFECGIVPLHFSLYYIHMLKWFSVIPRENFYVTTFENYFKNPFAETLNLWNFLRLYQPHVTSEEWTSRLNKRTNKNEKYNYHEDPDLQMLPKTRIILKEFFYPFNVLLATILGQDKFLWN